MHDATEFTLRGTLILNRPLEYIHAYSAKQAEALLREHTDIAVILLDVVMETPNAGLDLIKTIRGPLANTQTRIILRTGEPNQAPEIQIIRDYDINDYKLKSELNQKDCIPHSPQPYATTDKSAPSKPVKRFGFNIALQL